MATKLKLVLKSPQFALAFKALIFGAFLALAKLGGFSILSTSVFILVAVVLFTRPLFRTFDHFVSLLVLVGLAIFVSNSSNEAYFGLVLVYFSVLFYILLGIKDLILIKRVEWHKFFNAALSYPVFLLFFYYSQAVALPRIILAFLAIFVLLEDLFRKRVFTWAISLIIIEIIWAIGLLPIGYLNSANLALLSYVTISDLSQRAIQGGLSSKKILIYSTVFMLLSVLILGVSRWSF